jgi:hypothetical protein
MMPLRYAAALALSLAASLPGLASAQAGAWRGDFETGDLSQWRGVQSVDRASRLKVVRSPVAEGEHALQVTVRAGDVTHGGTRNELVGPAVREGEERWYRWRTLWPHDAPRAPHWQLFVQWHHDGDDGSPPLAFHVQGDRVVLGGVPRPFEPSVVYWSAPLVRGVWHEFVLNVRWSADPRRGLLELWYDGVRVLPLTHVPTLFPGQGGYLKVGLYRHPAIRETQVVFHDGFIAGASRADVLGNPALARAGAERTTTGAEGRSSPARDGAGSGDGPTPEAAPHRRTESRTRAPNEGDVRIPLPVGGVELACDVVRLRCKVTRGGRGAGRRAARARRSRVRARLP